MQALTYLQAAFSITLYQRYKKKTTLKDTFQNWLWTYGGNLVGALFIAWLVYMTGIFSGMTEGHYLLYVTEKKNDDRYA